MRNYSSVPAYNLSIIWKSLCGVAGDDVTILPGGAHKQGRDHESMTHPSLKELGLFNGKFPSLEAYAEMNLWGVNFRPRLLEDVACHCSEQSRQRFKMTSHM